MKLVMLSLLAFFVLMSAFLVLLPVVPWYLTVLIGINGVLAVMAIEIAIK